MFTAIVLIALALGGYGWWSYRRNMARSAAAAEDDPFERHDSAQAYEKAKAQAELQRWSGPQ